MVYSNGVIQLMAFKCVFLDGSLFDQVIDCLFNFYSDIFYPNNSEPYFGTLRTLNFVYANY